MPNTENIRKWVDALRSGEFTQKSGQLEYVTLKGEVIGNCCLGVACRVAMKNGVPVEVSRNEDDVTTFDGARGVLPDSVTTWIGMDMYDPLLFTPDGRREHATHLNDTEGKDFSYIADAIERTYLR